MEGVEDKRLLHFQIFHLSKTPTTVVEIMHRICRKRPYIYFSENLMRYCFEHQLIIPISSHLFFLRNSFFSIPKIPVSACLPAEITRTHTQCTPEQTKIYKLKARPRTAQPLY